MLEKKLTTLGCVAGILALGACYGTLTAPPPPPPPVAPIAGLGAYGVKSIRVTVVNGPDSHHLDPVEVTRAMIATWRGHDTGVKLRTDNGAGKEDAVLQVTVESDGWTPPQSGPLSGSYPDVWVRLSGTLTAKNGDVIWHESSTKYSPYCAIPAEEAPELWKVPKLKMCVTNKVSIEFVDQLVHFLGVPHD